MEFSRKRLGIPNALLKSMKAMRTMWEVGIEVGCLLVVLGLDAAHLEELRWTWRVRARRMRP